MQNFMSKFDGFFAVSLFIASFFFLVGCGAADETTEPTNGVDGKSCSVTPSGVGAYTMVCPDGTSQTWNDGADGPQGGLGGDGTNGLNGVDAKPCSVKENGNGTSTVACPDGSSVTWSTVAEKGEKGEDAVLPTCKVDTDCAQNEYCNSMGICIRDEAEPIPECSDTKLCPQGLTCVSGFCTAPPTQCQANSDCWSLNTQSCDGNIASLQAYACSFGSCVWLPVQNKTCPFGCSQGSCLPQEDECSVDADCGTDGPPWCGDGVSIFYNQGFCESGTCVYKKWLLETCAFGCGNSNAVCNAAPLSCPPSLNPCLHSELQNGQCVLLPNVGASCDDGNSTTNPDTCSANGVCVGKPIVNPPAPTTCRSLTLKPGFQFFGLVADPAANGEPIGEWAIFPNTTVSWCGVKVFAFNVATDNAEGNLDWVLYGTQDANGNTCPEAVQSYPQGLNYVLTDIFQGSLPAELGCVRRCTTGGWVNWVCQSPN